MVVDDLYTEPGCREVGIGELVMQALVDWCRERGCFGVDSLALPGDRHTKNFFESFGLVARAIVVHKRSEEHTSELQSLMRISYAVFCLKKKNKTKNPQLC